jgi:hypothetical protein
MYESIVPDDNTALQAEIGYGFDHVQWSISNIPDPKDTDPVRHTILVVVPECLVIAFN